MPDFSVYRDLWKHPAPPASSLPAGHEYPGWPEAGVAVMGDFSGIQNFVFRPTPGAGGAARRLRSRSFRVSAYAELAMRWCQEQLAQGLPRTLYAAGGKFLLGASDFPDWEATIERMRSELDQWTWRRFDGELAFHLAAARFESGKIPRDALQRAMDLVRGRPLEKALRSSAGWSEDAFFHRAEPKAGRCDACGMTKPLEQREDEWLCQGCVQDQAIGKELPGARFALISNNSTSPISALGKGMALHDRRSDKLEGDLLAFDSGEAGARHWPLFRHLPCDDRKNPLTFEQLARFSPGSRQWLAYLRIDGDSAGRRFTELQGDPVRTWALSRLLNSFFADTANRLVSSEFRRLYPVYGGGDDLFVVGPWIDVLDFARDLRQELQKVLGEDLTFSAGVSLSKPREHILTQARLAGDELKIAKDSGRNSIRALGVTADWGVFADLLKDARKVATWAETQEIPGSFLHQLLQLHGAWKQHPKTAGGHETARRARFKPLLHYQIERNLEGDAKDWAKGLLLSSSLWPWADFIARYAMLAAQREKQE